MPNYSDISTDYSNSLEYERNIGFKGDLISDLQEMVQKADSVKCACGLCDRWVPLATENRCFVTNKRYHDDCWTDHVDGIRATTRQTEAWYVKPCVQCQERRERQRDAMKLVPTVEVKEPGNPEGKVGTLA